MNSLNLTQQSHERTSAIIADYKAKKKDADESRFGLVIYTDGGCDQHETGDHGPAGGGVHGYLFDYHVGKTISYQPNGYTLTSGGYYDSSTISRKNDGDDADADLGKTGFKVKCFPLIPNNQGSQEKKAQEVYRIQPVAYFDMVSYLARPTTNNRAELDAMIMAMEFALGFIDEIESIHFRVDSKYVLDGIIHYIEAWKSFDWRGRTSDIKNIDMWKKIYDLRQKLLQYVADGKLKMSFEHVAAHTDYYGNKKADELTHKGRIADNLTAPALHIAPASNYFKAAYTPNKLLAMARWYYMTGDDQVIDGKHVYYIGRHGKEEMDVAYGSRTQELCSAVVITDDDPVLKTLREFYEEQAKSYKEDLVYFTYVDQVFNSNNYDELHDHGLTYADAGNKRISMLGSTLAVRASPVNTAFVAFEQFKLLERKLLEFKEGRLNSKHVLTDITDYIYGYKVGKKNEKIRITLPDDEPALSIKAKHRFNLSDEIEEHAVVLTRGLDMPRRNVFLGIMEDEPEVYLLTWHESRVSFRYVTLIKTAKGDYGIWCGAYSNICYLANAK